MNLQDLHLLLEQVKNGSIDIATAEERLKVLPYADIGHTRFDTHRELRTGAPEVIYGAGKSVQQVTDIVTAMLPRGNNILVTRVRDGMYEAIRTIPATVVFHEQARIISIQQKEFTKTASYIAIVTAGTSDIPVAEEAAITAEFLGNTVKKIFDVGVAGLHRIVDKLETLRQARVIIVIAGMEGALASVLGGMVDKPIIGVPTSIGYGANFGGISALLSMLTGCSGGVSVVNIDNGFGAACIASRINKLS